MPAGRPSKFQCASEIKHSINDYFNCIKDNNGNWIKPPTLAGLCLALDLTREGLRHYKRKNNEFADTITRAKQVCETYLEEQMILSNNRNLRFIAQCGYGWSAKAIKQKQDISVDRRIIEAREKHKNEMLM